LLSAGLLAMRAVVALPRTQVHDYMPVGLECKEAHGWYSISSLSNFPTLGCRIVRQLSVVRGEMDFEIECFPAFKVKAFLVTKVGN
jgi:hypothetical protein